MTMPTMMAERRAGDERRAGAGLEQPVVEAALAELVVGEDLGVRQPARQRLARTRLDRRAGRRRCTSV